MKKTIYILALLFSSLLTLQSCIKHPFYKRMTRGNWQKDTTWILFPNLPNPVKDTLTTLFDYWIENDNSKRPFGYISLNSNYEFSFTGYYNFDSPKLVIPFGYYFKLNNKKFHFDYGKLGGPLLYYDNSFYYSTGVHSIKRERKQEKDVFYKELYFVKYHLKKRWLK